MPKPKKLLILYYNFPPVKVPGAVRLHNFYNAALPYFEDIHVLTTSNRHFFLQDDSLETGCPNITEVPAWDLRRLALRKKAGNAPYVSTTLKERPLGRFLRRLLDSFPFNILISDGGLVYILAGYRQGKRLVKEQGITHLFSSFRPYSDHIIAYLLKRRFPHLYWVADFRDLHVDPAVKTASFPGFQSKANRFFLRRANLLATVSEGLEHHLKPFNENTYVLYNGFNGLIPREIAFEFDRFTILYTGSLFMNKRDPRPLLATLSSLFVADELKREQVQLVYAGRDGARWMEWIKDYGLQDIFINKGLVPITEARAMQAKAHINLLLTYTSPELKGNLTGKIYEYLAARRPIVVLVKGPRDEELEKMFEDLNAGQVVYNEDQTSASLTNFIQARYQEWLKTGEVESSVSKQALQKFEWPGIMARLIQHIDAHEPEI